MLIKLILIGFITFVFTGNSSVFSQEDEGEATDEDSAEVSDNDWDNWDNWDNEWDWDDFKFEFDMFDSYKSPSISLTYGLSNMKIHNFSESFADSRIPEIKLGYTSEKPSWNDENIVNYKYSYLFLSNITTDISGTPEANDIESSLWRFGFGWANGYGYSLGAGAAILPYNSYSFSWSRLDVKNFPANPEDVNKLLLYDGSFRFGTGSEVGLRIRVIPLVTFEAGYERSVIFERHLFWKWAGSALIEASGHWALDAFVEKIMDSSPYAGPVVGFILKSALSYGIYELRQEKMNWPFSSAAPLSYDQVKFGMTFNF
jgi:hypothetical protein